MHPNAIQKLILFGGGPLPVSGLRRLRECAGARHAHDPEVLLITWASECPEDTFERLASRLDEAGFSRIAVSAASPIDATGREHFLLQLASADAVFFSGGDQNRIALALGHADIHRALHETYAAGVPFAGTSAGTAIMSRLMISGDGDPGSIGPQTALRGTGLGLLDGVVLDQHFLKRQRQNRLFSLVLEHPELLGVGVDEGAALEVTGGRHAQVLGPERVMIIGRDAGRAGFSVGLYRESESFDLRRPWVPRAEAPASGRAAQPTFAPDWTTSQ